MTQGMKGKAARLLFLLGLVLAFISVFLDAYYYTAHVSGALIADWTFNNLLGWHSSLVPGIAINDALRPAESSEVLVMSIILVVLVFISAFGATTRNVEATNSIEKSMPYIYLGVFTLMIIGYFIIVMPFTFFFPNDLFFPFMNVKDLETNIVHSYCIGPAYVLQVAAFLIAFPYVIFSVLTLRRFESEKNAPEAIIEKTLEESREEIPIDKFIAELNFESKREEDAALMYEKFQRQRRRNR